MSKFLDQAIVALFLAIIVFSALAHGAVEAWAMALSSGGIVIALLLWMLKACWEKQWTVRLPAPVWPLLAFLVLGLWQSITWTSQTGQRTSLSLDVEATRAAVLWLGLLVLAFVVAANVFTGRGRLSLLCTFFICFGLVLALFALLQQATWNGRFYWWRAVDTQSITSPFGPFVHHGHYAGYLEMLLPFPVAFLIVHQLRLEKKLLYGFAATIMGVSVIASLARGGMFSVAVQLIFLVAMSYRMMRQHSERGTQTLSSRARISAVVALITAIFLGVFWIGAEPVLNRIAQGQEQGAIQSFFNERGWIWRDTLTMFRAHPFIGVGLGAFETAFPIYSQYDGSLTVNAAHNDYLQLLAEGGLSGAILLGWFMLTVLRVLLPALQSHDTRIQALALGGAAGMVGMLVHSCFDFNLQLPSHALLFLTLVAVVSGLEIKRTMAVTATSPANFFDLAERLSKRGTS